MPRLSIEIRRTLRVILYCMRVIRKYKNWIEVCTKIHKKQRINRLILRNRIQIDAPEDHPFLLDMVNETFFENVHTPVGLPIEANDIVVDIGANVGIFTLLSALRTQRMVHAFEPSPENVEFLNRNIRSNRLRNVIVHNVAVCDKTEKLVKLYLGEGSVGHSLLSAKCPTEKCIEVPSISLQHIIDNIVNDDIDFLKIDCEGCEGLIFLSTPREYLKRIKKIVVEFHNQSSPLKHDAIQRLLEEAGFETWLYWEWGKDSPYGYLYGKRD